jgi:SAM-dependent methyltransferase
VSGTDGGQEHQEELPGWVPEGVDVTVPNVARGYDYLLGGCHNFAVDQELAEQGERYFPGMRQVVYANRAFLGRVVRWLVGAGIRQFLDIGSGIPTVGNVHEIAEEAAPGVRVMYVDIDPVAVAHTRAILAENPRVGVLRADLRRPLEIVDHPDVTALLDFSVPVAVVLSGVLHFLSDADDPYAVVAQLRDSIVAGSYIALTNWTQVAEHAEKQEALRRMSQQTPTPVTLRPREQVARLLDGLDIVEPGVVPATDWRPDPGEDTGDFPPGLLLAAVGRKP